MKTRTLLQYMRIHADFEDFTVHGSQFANQNGELEWEVALCSKSDPPLRAYCIVAGKPEERLSGNRLEAAKSAIAKWEAEPVWVK